MVVQRSELSRVKPCRGGSLFYFAERSTPFGEIHPQISNFEQRAPQTNGGFWGVVPQQTYTEFALVFGA